MFCPKSYSKREKTPQNSNLTLAPNTGLLISASDSEPSFYKDLAVKRAHVAKLGSLLTPPVQHFLRTAHPFSSQPMTSILPRGARGCCPGHAPPTGLGVCRTKEKASPQRLHPLLDHAAGPRTWRSCAQVATGPGSEPVWLPWDLFIHRGDHTVPAPQGPRSQVAERRCLPGADRYGTCWLGEHA